jgi:hypothetical protein
MNRLKTWWLRIPYHWRLAVVLYLSVRLLTWAFGVFLYYSHIIPPGFNYNPDIEMLSGSFPNALFGVWMRWDGVSYDLIANLGYHSHPKISAFWPLYPLLSSLLIKLHIHPIISLIIISNLATFLALVVFLAEVENLMGREKMVPTGLVLLLFPGAFFFFTPYPTSLALLLVLLTWRFARKNKWFLAALTGLLSGLTHPSVIPLAFLIFFLILRRIKNSTGLFRWVLLVVPFMPLAGVAVFLAWRENQRFLPYIQLLQTYWGTQVFDPSIGFRELLDYVFSGNLLAIMKLIVLILVIASIIWIFHNRFYILGFYQVGLFVYLISVTLPGDPLGSIIRYSLMSFPTYIAIGAWMKNHPKAYLPSLLGLCLFNLFLCGLFLNWVYVS